MTHPSREERAGEIVLAIDNLVRAMLDRYVHMATNDEPVIEANRKLAELLAASIK